MIQQKSSAPHVDSSFLLNLYQRKALRLLWEAWLAACSEGQDVWQFAMEIDRLRGVGLNHTDLRLLLRWGYLAHAQEYTTAESDQRIFQPLDSLILPERTCFVLTEQGTKIDGLGGATNQTTKIPPLKEIVKYQENVEVPRWDSSSRQLRWRDLLIKQFRQPSTNQETVLAALEEEGWPRRIDDPLPQKLGLDPKIRLHDTIKALNRHQRHRILFFLGDGSGRGILWQTWDEER